MIDSFVPEKGPDKRFGRRQFAVMSEGHPEKERPKQDEVERGEETEPKP